MSKIRGQGQELVWDGYRKIKKMTFRLPTGIEKTYEIKVEGHPVCIFPLTDHGTVVMAKQFRPGPMKVWLELPGGGIEKDEEPLAAAKRELLEETGYTGDFQFIGTSGGDAYATLLRYNFLATNCHKVQEPENNPQEPIIVEEISVADFHTHLQTGELSDLFTGYRALEILGLL